MAFGKLFNAFKKSKLYPETNLNNIFLMKLCGCKSWITIVSKKIKAEGHPAGEEVTFTCILYKLASSYYIQIE